jgi:hypothetical protein
MRSTNTNHYAVRFSDGEENANGIAGIVGTLLEENLKSFPSRTKTARKIPRPVAIFSKDTDSACTISFGGDSAAVHNDVVGSPSITVIATIAQILDVSRLKMKAGGLVPVGFFTKRGISVITAILTRKLVIKGLFTHTVTLLRTIALISVAE